MLFEEGVFATPIVFPMVAREKSRIRCQINAKMTKNDLDDALRAIEKCGKAVKAI
jgi:glycine C-acetyltransferase